MHRAPEPDEGVRVVTYQPGARRFYFGLGLVGLLGLAFMDWKIWSTEREALPLAAVCTALMGPLGLYLMVMAVRTAPQLWLYPDGRFDYPSWWGKRRRDHVRHYKGLRTFQHQGVQLHLVRVDGKRTWPLTLSALVDPPSVYEWFHQRLPDLDLEDLERERQGILSRHTSDQDDPGDVLARLARLNRLARVWIVVTVATEWAQVFPTLRSLRNWRWLIVDVGLLLFLYASSELARHRHLVVLRDRQHQHHLSTLPALMLLIVAVLPALRLGAGPLLTLTNLATGLVVGALMAWLPASPDVTARQRVFFLIPSVLFASVLPLALNVGLAPHPVHSLHTAHVTDVYPGARGEFNVSWEYDTPVGSSTGGSWGRQREPLAIGTRYEVELAQGALGWHWLVGMRRLDAPAGSP